MVPNFALSLSFDGIRLLHRVTGGWHVVGDVDVDQDDMRSALANLRKTALALDSSGLRTKLLIHNEQIKYLALESTQTDIDDIRNALEGATPYALKDLVIDFERSGGRTHIAAVARETLDEAEAFAKEHKFAPVAFVAVAEPFTFNKEVFFGPTSIMTEVMGPDAVVEREDTPITVRGAVPKPSLDIDTEEKHALNASAAENVKPAEIEITSDTPKPNPQGKKLEVPVPISTMTAKKTNIADQIPAIVGTAPQGKPKPLSLSPAMMSAPANEVATPPLKSEGNISVSGAANTAKRPFKAVKFVAALAALAAAAWWINSATDDGIAGWFAAPEPEAEAADVSLPVAPMLGHPNTVIGAAENVIQVAAIEDTPALNAEESPSEQVRDERGPEIAIPATLGLVLSPAEAERIYATTGVWQRAPRFPTEPRTTSFEGMVRTNTLPAPIRIAQLTRQDGDGMAPDLSFLAPTNPPSPDAKFERDQNGFILATPDGTVTPDGALVISGRPAVVPPLRPIATETTPSAASNGVVVIVGPPAIEPPLRPAANPISPELDNQDSEDVVVVAGPPSVQPPLRPEPASVESEEPASIATGDVPAGGVALSAFRPTLRPDDLAPAASPTPTPTETGLRPRKRPNTLTAVVAATEAPKTPDIASVIAAIAEAAPPSPYNNATSRAIVVSSRPDTRPRNFARVVASARERQTQQASRVAAKPATTTQQAPAQSFGAVPGGVAQAATMDNAIRVRDINLIGVYGRPNSRRALVRLGNGRYLKVEVGSNLDGGRVTAIGDSALNYVKRGRTYALQLPSG